MTPTFAQAGLSWERSLAKTIRRNGKPLAANTLRIYGRNLTRLVEHIGSTRLPVSNKALRDYVAEMRRQQYSAAQIVSDLNVVKLVCESIRNENGDCLFPLKLNHDFISTPIINPTEQNAPCASREDIERTLAAPETIASLVAILAGAGLRISEALALVRGDVPGADCWDSDNAAIHIRRTLKTPAAARTVYLCSELNAFLAEAFATCAPGSCLFTIRRSDVYLELDKLKLPPCHAYRRFRVTVCRKAGMNEECLKQQIGHSRGSSVTNRYDRTRDDIEFIRSEVERVGLGFSLPSVATPVAEEAEAVSA